jgi:DNA (cytosine-5)-methyltransferase 1
MFIDLFCGCGGLSLGANLAGMQEEVAIDIDKNLTSSFLVNFPNAKLLNQDLVKLNPKDLRALLNGERPTAIVGGPPCQGFSIMGRRDKSDPRNLLLQTYFDYVAFFRPKFFLMENVPGLNTKDSRGLLDRALNKVPGHYNILPPMILDAADYGAATTRPRLVVIGYDPGCVDRIDVSDFEKVKVRQRIDVRAAISDLPLLSKEPEDGEWLRYRARRELSKFSILQRKSPPKGLGSKICREMLLQKKVSGCQATNHTADVIERFSELSAGDRDPISKYPKLSWDRQAHVLRAGTGADKGSYQAARPIHPTEPRVITVREAARIQGFPDWFQFHPTKWHSHRMIGNSVSPIFAKALFKVILSKLEATKSLAAAD